MISTYTIFGIYQDNLERHHGIVKAHGPMSAEKKYRNQMLKKGHTMLVAGVLPGTYTPVDEWTHAATMGHV